MKIKAFFLFLPGLFFFVSQPSNAQGSHDHLVPVSKDQRDELRRILSIVQIADIRGLDTLNCGNTIKDSAIANDLQRHIEGKRQYLATELLHYRRAEEEARVQNTIYKTNSIDVLDAIRPDKELLGEDAYEDLNAQISWKKQIIERENLESAYEQFRFFGMVQYVPVNKTINENLPDDYFIRQEEAMQRIADFDEILSHKTECLRGMQQVLGEVLISATVEQLKSIRIPGSVRDNMLREALAGTISESVNRMKLLDPAEVKNIRDKIVYYLTEMTDTNEMGRLLDGRVKNKCLKAVIDETIRLRKEQVRQGNREGWAGAQIESIYESLLSVRERGTFEYDSATIVDPGTLNNCIGKQLASEMRFFSSLDKKLRQYDEAATFYLDLAFSDNPGDIGNLAPGEAVTDDGMLHELMKAKEEKTALLIEYEDYRRMESELARIDLLIRKAYSPDDLKEVRADGNLSDPGIVKLLEGRVEQKIVLLNHKCYIEKQAKKRNDLLVFISALRKAFTFQALTWTRNHAFTEDQGNFRVMIQLLEDKWEYFESQSSREKQLSALF